MHNFNTRFKMKYLKNGKKYDFFFERFSEKT